MGRRVKLSFFSCFHAWDFIFRVTGEVFENDFMDFLMFSKSDVNLLCKQYTNVI